MKPYTFLFLLLFCQFTDIFAQSSPEFTGKFERIRPISTSKLITDYKKAGTLSLYIPEYYNKIENTITCFIINDTDKPISIEMYDGIRINNVFFELDDDCLSACFGMELPNKPSIKNLYNLIPPKSYLRFYYKSVEPIVPRSCQQWFKISVIIDNKLYDSNTITIPASTNSFQEKGEEHKISSINLKLEYSLRQKRNVEITISKFSENNQLVSFVTSKVGAKTTTSKIPLVTYERIVSATTEINSSDLAKNLGAGLDGFTCDLEMKGAIYGSIRYSVWSPSSRYNGFADLLSACSLILEAAQLNPKEFFD